MQNIPRILKLLAKTSSTLQKKLILKETKSPELEFVFKNTYDPFITFGTTKIDTTGISYRKCEVDERWLKALKILLQRLKDREITGNAARDEVKNFIMMYPEEWGEVVLNILKKDLRIGAGKRLINDIYKDLFAEDICMSAAKYDKTKVTFPVYADTKLDGVRCIALINRKEIKLYSRNGKEFKNYDSIMNSIDLLNLPDNTKLDGEIVMGHFQDIMRTVSRKKDGIEFAKDAVYNVFDTAEHNKIFTERLKTLEALEKTIDSKKLKHLKIIKGQKINNENELMEYYEEQLKEGHEGIMVKPFDGIYEHKRTRAWMKMKPTESEDLSIVRIDEGTGKYKNLLGSFVCELPNGLEVNVGSGFKDEERTEFWEKRKQLIGQTIEVKYQEKTRDGSLRFPVFVRFRPDKS